MHVGSSLLSMHAQRANFDPLLPHCRFVARFEATLERVRNALQPPSVVVVGGGAGGVELAMALQHRLAGEWRATGRGGEGGEPHVT